MAVTRRQLRRDCLRILGDARVLSATANSASNIAFTDQVNLTGEAGLYAGREVLFTGGTAANLGLRRSVTYSSRASAQIQFDLPLPALVAAGDECEMVNTRGVGFRFDEVHDAINQSIRAIGGDAYLVQAASDDASFTYGTPLTVPPEFVTVEDVQWQDPYDAGRWHSIPKASRANGRGWWVDRPTRSVNITGRIRPITARWEFDGGVPYTIRLWGLATPLELYDDEAATDVNYSWLVANTNAILLRGRYYRMPTPETERLMYDALQEARSTQPRATTRRGPFSERI